MVVVCRRFRYRFKGSSCKLRIRKFAAVLLFVGVVLVSGAFVFENRIKPLVDLMAEATMKNMAIDMVNLSVNESFGGSGVGFLDLVKTEKDNNGNVIALVTDAIAINELKAELMALITGKMRALETEKIGIPVGNLFKNRFLYGRGPKLYVKIMQLGTADVSVRNNFLSAGINQTRHEILLEVTSNVSVVTPVGSRTAEVKTQIPIADTIVVGGVPNTYTNIQGCEKSNSEVGLSVFKQ